jgi:DNA polymerase III epsilon subunit-like protein
VTVFGFIAAKKTEHSVKTMCRVLGVSRSGFHAWARRTPSTRAREDARLTERILEIHALNWRLEFLSDCGDTPSSAASCGTDLPLRLSSSTASRRNSNGYGAGMNTDPRCQARRPSDQVSTKAGELQWWARLSGGRG